jgi:protein-tyrosine phosphatase
VYKTALGPEELLPKLYECGVNTIIRLNEEEYDREFFLQNGIDHVDVIFPDGTCPNQVAPYSNRKG